jgi:hypothetical protein
VATQKDRVRKPPFTIDLNDYYGSRVVCSVERWENHILGRAVGNPHPELAGRKEDVEKAIQDPHRIVPSKKKRQADNTLGFELDTEMDTVRVLVVYDDPSKKTTGATQGFVLTSYLVDPRLNSQVGTPIYVKGASTTSEVTRKEKK